jgi:hypothetical protein
MDLNSLLHQIDDDKIRFEDRIAIAFMVMGGLFFIIIVISLLMNAMQFEQMEFESPFL